MTIARWFGLAVALILCAGSVAAAPAYDEAALNRAIQSDPDNARAWFRLGVLQTHDGRILQAIEAFRQVIRIHPDYPEPHRNLAAIYRSLGDFDAATEELRKVMTLAPRDVRVQVELADLYMERAEGLYRAVARRDADNRSVKRDRLAGLLCRRSLARLSDDGAAMDRLLARLLKPPFSSESAGASTAQPFAPPPVAAETMRGAVAEPYAAQTATRAPTPSAQAPSALSASHPGPVASPYAAAGAAEAPAAEERSRQPTVDQEQAVRATIEAWRKAWQSRDSARYFSFYSRDFKPQRGSRKAWQRHKQRVLARAGSIRIRLSNLRLHIDGDQAEVRFDQQYRSRRYHSLDHKRLQLVREADGWKIIREVSLGS